MNIYAFTFTCTGTYIGEMQDQYTVVVRESCSEDYRRDIKMVNSSRNFIQITLSCSHSTPRVLNSEVKVIQSLKRLELRLSGYYVDLYSRVTHRC